MPGTAFSSSNWTGYDEHATNLAPSASLTDFTLIVDVSNMSATWKSNVQSDGADIRVTKQDGTTELPYDLIDWAYNAGAPTGLIRVKWSGTLATSGTQKIRIWAGYTGGTATAYDASETYGSDNAYASHWEGYWPLHETPSNGATFADRTSNANDGTLSDSGGTATNDTGQVGNGLRFTGASGVRIDCGNGLLSSAFGTLMSWVNPDDRAAFYGVAGTRSGNNDEFNLGIRVTDGRAWGPSWDGQLITPAAIPTGAFTHLAVNLASSSPARNLYENGSSVDSDANIYFSTFNLAFQIGSRGANSLVFKGVIDDVQLHTTALSADWIAEEYSQTNDNATHFGSWTWTAVSAGSNIPAIMHHYRQLRIA